MARLATIGVLLVALMVMAEASLDPIMVEEENQYQGDMCRQELRGQRMHSCQRYLQRGGRGGGYLMIGRGDGYQGSLDDCCRELKRVDHNCRCEAIKQALDEAQSECRGDRRGYGGYMRRGNEEDMRGRCSGDEMEMRRRAENLPSMCRMDRPRHCQMMMGY